jgi:NADPH:quinone reductase-like Zn-dependent oxidoreductase
MGSVFRARPIEEKIRVTRAFARQVNPLLAAGLVRPVVDRVFELGDVAAAHTYMESDASFGKVILTV